MTDRRVRVLLDLVASGFQAGVAKAKASTDALIGSLEKNQKALGDVSTAMMGAGVAALAGVGAVAKTAMDWESAWAGVKKTVDGTDEQLRSLEGSLREMARTMPATHAEIAATAEAAGQLGVATEDVASFTRTMIMLGETTNLTADEAATSIAQISNIMGTAAGDVDRFAATLVKLGNNGASTEAEILNLANRVAGAAQIVGMTEQGVLALSNAMASVGINAELGGSAMSRAMIGMNTAVLSGGERLEAFAQISSMTAAEFSAAWKADPTKAVQAFVSGLDRINKEGGNAAAALGDVGLKGTQNTQVFLALAGAHEMLADSIAMGADAWAKPTALLDEYAQRANTTQFKVEVAWNTMKDAAITAGSATLPVIAGLADGAATLVSSFASLPQPVQSTVVGLAALGGAGLVAVGGTMKLVSTFADLKGDLKTLGVDLSGLGGKMGSLPWGKIAAGAAIGGAAITAITIAVGEYQKHALASISTTEQVATSMANLAQGAGIASLNVQVDQLNEALGKLGMKQLDGIGGMFKQLGDDARSGLGGVREGVDGLLFGMRTQSGLIRDEVEKIDAALAGMAQGGDLSGAQNAFRKLTDEAARAGESIEFTAQQFPQFQAILATTAAALDVTGLSASDYANWMRGDVPDAIQAAVSAGGPLVSNLTDQQRALVETASAAERNAAALRETSEAQAKAAQGAAGLIGGLTGMEAAIDAATEAVKENGKTLDANTEAGRNNLNALASLSSSTGRYVEQLAKAGASQAELDAAMTRGRESFIQAAMAMDDTSASAAEAREKAEALADEMGLMPSQVTTLFTTPGADVSKQQAKGMESAVKKIPSLAETSILAPGARPSKAEVDSFVKSVGNVPGLTEAEIRTIAELYGVDVAKRAVASVKDKTVTIRTVFRNVGSPMLPAADGGMFANTGAGLVQAFAAGGFHSSIGAQQPQIRPAGGAGILWAEEGAGPWEAFISGHPAKRRRSRWLLEETARRLGGAVSWATAYADGGIHTPHYGSNYSPPPVYASSRQAQVAAAPQLTQINHGVDAAELAQRSRDQWTHWTASQAVVRR